jgi:flagellar protein FliS
VNTPSSTRAYREADILAASPGRLVVITFDGMIASLMRARAGMLAANYDVTLPAMDRARAFVGELLGALNHEKGGDLAGRLSAIYVFVLSELQTLTRTRDVERLDAIISLMRELRDAFAEIASAPRSAVA